MTAASANKDTLIHDNILDAVGNTPLVRLPADFDPEVQCEVLLKLEFGNPGGSLKDRIAIHMIRTAVERGDLIPGGRIVECSSGNTGAGLAMAASALGFDITVVIPDKMSQEKISAIEALGADVVITPANVDIDDPRHYTKVAGQIAKECGGWWPDQYHNTDNTDAHYRTTGPEIWKQCEGRLDAFVAGAGTGGTLTGVAQYMKEVDPSVQIVGVDPPGSILAHWWKHREMCESGPYAVEGAGEEEVPGAWDPDIIDDYFVIEDALSFHTARKLASETGIFAGGSSGMNLAAALKVARKLPASARVVTILPDGGRAYLSKVYSKDWMRDRRFLPPVSQNGATLQDLLRNRERAAVSPEDTLAWAVHQTGERGVRPLPVLQNGELAGVLDEDAAIACMVQGEDLDQLRVADFIQPAPTVLEATSPWSEALSQLQESECVLVRDGKGLVPFSRRDLIRALPRLKHEA
ncbi:MAG: cystathionine beta-synthase [Planctomycetes bacterium]|jgi:cystathionine beta-synthase|nr:cystathionine beta-synthase [Planctomycetota bacterium]MDP6128373.1 pyridoxal-phosphate dependent enzyme [Planctomycetota bacterium]MDP7245403.1 pyridoxal-phosphate dependent enzyme [Planctomycetota bacterium]|tara:strand:- start:25123 stop:26517 length:1395 start_codon:yes stop_codon:yes gene_type:complete